MPVDHSPVGGSAQANQQPQVSNTRGVPLWTELSNTVDTTTVVSSVASATSVTVPTVVLGGSTEASGVSVSTVTNLNPPLVF